MSFIIGNENIKYQLKDNFFANAMDITSFLTDGIVFSDGKYLPNSKWKEQWMKYCRMIMPNSGYIVEYSHSYKSDKFKDITDYEIYKGDKLIDVGQTWGLENAEAQAYIKISQLSTFKNIFDEGKPKIEWIINKIPKNNFRLTTDMNSRHYRLSYDLRTIVGNKALLREWKLSLINI